MSKRSRGEEEEAADTEGTQEDPSRAPALKKVRIIQRVDPEVSHVSSRRQIPAFSLKWKNPKRASHSLSLFAGFFFSQEEMLTEDSAEAEGVVPTDDAEASQVCSPAVAKTHQANEVINQSAPATGR